MTSPEVIIGGLSLEHIVEKSRPLMLLKAGSIGLEEVKVLDTYLSRINARDPEHRSVRFAKVEYERLMGLQQIRPEQLKKHIEKLYNADLELTDESRPGWSDNIKLFSRRKIYKDTKGQWWIELTCTPEAKQYFFSVDSMGYFRYYLSNIAGLTSLYSYNLYMYFLMQAFRRAWKVEIAKLKEILHCDSKRYEEFKFFNGEILKKSIAEINEQTDMKVEYSVVRTGRRASHIEFTVVTMAKLPSTKKNTKAEEKEKKDETEDDVFIAEEDDSTDFYAEALPESLTRDEVAMLQFKAQAHLPDTLKTFHEKELWIFDYLREKTLRLKAYASHHDVKSEYKWLLKAVEEDWK